MGLPDFAIKKPVTIFMILFGLAVFGFISLYYIPLEFLPNIDNPQVSVFVPYQSSTPSEIERNITIPLEESLSTVNGIDSLKSTSGESFARIVLEYELGTDLEMAMVEIRDRVDRVRHKLPPDVRRVIINRFSYDQIPVIAFSITSKSLPKDVLADKVNDVLKLRLERLEGVVEVRVFGVSRRQIDIELRLDALRAYNINLYQVFNDLRNNNVNLSAGYIMDGGSKYYIRNIGEFSNVEEIKNIPIADGRLRIKDIANVKYDVPERNFIYRLNGADAIGVVVQKSSRANIVNIVERIKAVLEEMKSDKHLKDLETVVFWDASSSVVENLDLLRGNGLIGAVFVILILFVFLRKFRSILIISIAIPLSVVISFAIFYMLNSFFGLEFSFNIISLMGLILSVGMLVDNSVVVLESIFRHKEEGYSAREAAIKGSKEIVMPVFAATLTTVAVFMVLMFGGDSTMSVWMKDFGISIGVIMFSSLFVALTLVPMASSVLYKKFVPGKDRLKGYFTIKYQNGLKNLLRFRWITLLATCLILVVALVLYQQIGMNFTMGGGSNRRIDINVEFASGLSLAERTKILEDTENLFLDKKEELDVKALTSQAGRLSGTLTLYLLDETDSTKKTSEIERDAMAMLPTIPGVVFKAGMFSQGSNRIPLSVRIQGPDTMVLERLGQEIEQELSQLYGQKNVSFNMEAGDERVIVSLNRVRAQRYGLTPQLVGYSLLSAFGERPVTFYRGEEYEVPVILRLREEDRTGLNAVRKMGLGGASAMVPLETVADLKLKKGVSTYEREDKEAVAQIRVIFTIREFITTLKGVAGYMEKFPLPAGYTWSFGEQYVQQFEEREASNFALIFALIMIYIIMVALFESFVHPFTIMTSIPFAFIGTFMLMRWTNTNIDGMTRLGFLVLIGIVVNNAIVLIDYINRLRWEGHSRTEAILIAGRRRLRPIVITALTTILALLPMAGPILFPGIFGGVEGQARQWAPLALVLIGGLSMSTFMTVLVTPCIYTIIDDFSKVIKRVFVRL